MNLKSKLLSLSALADLAGYNKFTLINKVNGREGHAPLSNVELIKLKKIVRKELGL